MVTTIQHPCFSFATENARFLCLMAGRITAVFKWISMFAAFRD